MLFFPDNTVLTNFALVNRMSLLKAITGDRGRWGATVADECARGARVPGLEEMARAREIFGAPIYPKGAEHIDIKVIQERLLSPGDASTAHLGEAETIVLMGRPGNRGLFVTDDRDAQRMARHHGLTVCSTWDLLKLAVRSGQLTAEELFADATTLVEMRRGWPPCGRSRADVQRWIES